MIIHKRKPVVITSTSELIKFLNTRLVKKLKRECDANSDILHQILKKEYANVLQFESEMKAIWTPKKTNFELFGYTEDEIIEEKQQRTAVKLQAIAGAIDRLGITEQEYNRRRQNLCVEFWIAKGHTEEEAIKIIQERQQKNSAKVSNQQRKESSPRTLEYWEKLGVDDPELHRRLHQRQSSPRCVEYWVKRGCQLDEAKTCVQKTQSQYAKLYHSQVQPEDRRKANHFCKEYWESKGYSDEEITQKLSDNGLTFSLDMCVAKYGIEEGTEIWKKRQENWQSSMSNLSEDIKREIKLKQAMGSRHQRECYLNPIGIPGLFYIIQIDEDKIKIGITIKEQISKRYKRQDLDGRRTQIFTVDDISHAYSVETTIKMKNAANIIKNDYGPFGWTEVIHNSTFESIAKEVELLLNNSNISEKT